MSRKEEFKKIYGDRLECNTTLSSKHNTYSDPVSHSTKTGLHHRE